MGIILPLLIFVAFLGLNSTTAYYSRQIARPPISSAARVGAQNFITYRTAVENYISANPTFTGTISLQSLAPFMNGALPIAMEPMNNVISSAPGGGIMMSVYAQNLAPGAISSTIAITQHDASIGHKVGGQWTSYSSATGSTVNVSIPDSNLVSMIQIN